MSDKAQQFLRKIQSKNQLKSDLKNKKATYVKLMQYPDLVDEAVSVQKEIRLIELELEKFD